MTSPLIQFVPEDAAALLELSQSVGWPHEIGDWKTTLAASQVFGQRDSAGKILSSSAIYRFEPGLAALAVVLVREEVRRQGLARAAVLKCLDQVPGLPVMLVATPFGQPLYESLGFQTVEQIVRLVAPQGTSLPAEGVVHSMTETDLPRALQLDRLVYLADRSPVLRCRWAQVEQGVMLPGGMGFAWRTVQRGGLVIGPVIARNADDAARLVGHLAAGFPGRIKIEVPERHTSLMDRLASAGFVIDSQRPLMLKNAETLAGPRELLFGLASLGYC